MPARPASALVALSLLVFPVPASAYQADIVPATNRPEAQDITGIIAINGADGAVHVKIANVNDAKGNSLDGQVTVHLRLRVNGVRRRVTFALTVTAGDGEGGESLGLKVDDRVILDDVRIRGPTRRTLAEAGVVTADAATGPPTGPPPSPGDCPAALESCQTDLATCNQDLDDCLSQ